MEHDELYDEFELYKTEPDFDELCDAYDLDDPKHPSYYESHVEAWDLYREGK